MSLLINFLITLILVILCFWSRYCESKNYCSAKFCNNTKQHVLCKFQVAYFGVLMNFFLQINQKLLWFFIFVFIFIIQSFVHYFVIFFKILYIMLNKHAYLPCSYVWFNNDKSFYLFIINDITKYFLVLAYILWLFKISCC